MLLASTLIFAGTALTVTIPQVGAEFSSAPETCAVLQSAYTAASGFRTPTYPSEVRAEARDLTLSRTVPDYRAKLALTSQEFDALAMRQDRYKVSNFKPACRWKGEVGPTTDKQGHRIFVTFSSPVFSESERLAIVEVSIREDWFGYGLICVARKARGAWESRCLNSWIN